MSEKSKLLKWAGSKSQISDKIRPFLLFDVPYIEPFCGSAVFFFEMAPRICHLNDTNEDLIAFYRQLQANPELVWEYYRDIAITEDTYYTVRSEFNTMEESAKKAGYFLYLNHFCFNGLYRTNRRGEFNTPYGARSKAKRKLTKAALVKFSKSLKLAHLYCDDFEKFLCNLKPKGACIYMDPPYFTNDERVFGEYGATTFKDRDLNRLYKTSLVLSKRNRVVISYKKCSEFYNMFFDHVVGHVSVTRNVGGFAGRRKIEQELVAVMDQRN